MHLICFLVWTLIFAGCKSNKHQLGKRQKIKFIKLNFSKIKCRSIVGKVWVAGCDELVYHFLLSISNHNKTDVKKCCQYDETVNNNIKILVQIIILLAGFANWIHFIKSSVGMKCQEDKCLALYNLYWYNQKPCEANVICSG